MPSQDLVVFRSSYWDPIEDPSVFLLVGNIGEDATIRHPKTGKEENVPLSSLRWADDERHDELLSLIQKNRVDGAKAVLAQDPLLDIRGTHDKPSMYWACYLPGLNQSLEETIDWLHSLGVDIDQRFRGITSLGHVIHEEDFEVAAFLLERGADLHRATLSDNSDIMSMAARIGSFTSMGWILSRGFQPRPTMEHLDILREDETTYHPNDYGPAIFSTGITLPLLHRAAIANYKSNEDALAMFNHLISHDTTWSQRDSSGNTALDLACQLKPDNAIPLGGLIAHMEANELSSQTVVNETLFSHRMRL